jgi:DNA-binding winged helix-turn-helix (wHTH) protein/predicted ATPase
MTMELKSNQPLHFGPYVVTGLNGQVLRRDRPLPLSPKAVAVLGVLASRAGQLVSKDELFAAVWAETVVSEGVLTNCIRELRQALGDTPAKPRYIETVHRRGYRFLAEVVSSQQPVVNSPSPRPQNSALPPPFSAPAPDPHPPVPRLVGRDTELARLHRSFADATKGERQVVFITGEPGIGKTALVDAFLSEVRSHEEFGVWGLGAEEEENRKPVLNAVKGAKIGTSFPAPTPQLLTPVFVGRGQCVEQYGAGEAYLPVLEALGQLCRQLGGEQGVRVLSRHAPTWLVQMPALLSKGEFEAVHRRAQGATRERMLREFAEAVEVLSANTSLVLVLEDLHWSDHATVDLLSMIARRREAARLLVVGTYRPADVVMSGHPLKAAKRELHTHGLCQEVAVSLLADAAVGQYLDFRFPAHDFPPSLAPLMYQRTEGNPLFLVNTVNALVQQETIREHDGQWQLAVPVQEVTVGAPESVRQLIEKQLERLSAEERQLLEVASVTGTEFSAAVLAATGGTAAQREALCDGLVRRGQFLHERGVGEWPDGTVAARYGFAHALYRNVVYQCMGGGRRARVHQQVGLLLEQGYGARAKEIASELAVHFEQGREPQRAVQYHGHAAQTALQRSAIHETMTHVHRGLALLGALPDTPERIALELPLQITLGAAAVAAKGLGAEEAGAAFARARELARHVTDSPTSFPILIGLAMVYWSRAEFQTALTIAEQCLHLAERSRNSAQLVMAHHTMGLCLHVRGDVPAARRHYEDVLRLYDHERHHFLAYVAGQDSRINVEGMLAWVLWHLGYPAQALSRSRQTCALAYDLGHLHSLAIALNLRAICHALCGALASAQEYTEETLQYTSAHGVPVFLASATICRGWILVSQGRWEDGIRRLRQGLTDYERTGTRVFTSWHSVLFVDACGKAGRIDDGLAALAAAFAFVEETGERIFEAELHRLQGELLLAREGKDGSRKTKVKAQK